MWAIMEQLINGRNKMNRCVLRYGISLISVLAVLCCTGSGTTAHGSSFYWTAYTEKDGLINNTVTSLSMDPGGYLWIGTGDSMNPGKGGLSVLDRLDQFTSYTSSSSFLDKHEVALRAVLSVI